MLDQQNRLIDYLRISVTDRCNLRCRYCMPAEGVESLPHGEILRYEEILRLARIFSSLGIRRIRLTGGEPLVRQNLDQLVRGLKQTHGIRSVYQSTNGVLLKAQFPALLDAGLDGVNLSIDTLDAAEFEALTRRNALADALAGLRAALAIPGFQVKINCVPSELNSDQWCALAELARSHSNLDVRFIELMPLGLGRTLRRKTEQEVLSVLEARFGSSTPCAAAPGSGPSRLVRFPGFQGRIGFISAMSHSFCEHCNRIRLTADGKLKPCLYYSHSIDLRTLLRSNADDDRIRNAIAQGIHEKPMAHHFSDAAPETTDSSELCPNEGESRLMNQIGG